MQPQVLSRESFNGQEPQLKDSTIGISSSTNTSMSQLSDFHVFPTLLPEIRHLIWDFALSQTRLVPICFLSPLTSQRSSSKPRLGFTSPARVPSVLHVCQEARNIAIKRFSLSFRVSGSITLPSKIYFDPQNDILYFPSWKRSPGCGGVDMFMNRASFQDFSNTVLLVDRQELLKVRTLAFHESLFMGHPENRSSLEIQKAHLKSLWWYIFDRFQNVVELTIAGCEDAVLDDFPQISVHTTNCTTSHPDIPSDPVVHDEGVLLGDAVDDNSNRCQDEPKDPPNETFYDLVLGAYWDLRKQEPNWVPPRWRVWRVSQSQGQRLREAGLLLGSRHLDMRDGKSS